MRRWLAISALSAAVLAVPSMAQHGGSRGGGSMGHGGFSSSGFHGGISSSGFRGGASLNSSPHFGSSFATGVRQPSFHSGTGFHRPGFGPGRFRNRVFFSTVWPGFYGYYGYPGFYDDFYSSTDSYPSYYYSGSAYDVAQNDLAQQQQDIDRLEDEVARLREERQAGSQESGDASRPQSQSRSEVSTPTILVFRDKHTQEVQNYAIVGGTLWVFSEQRATKLPLSWIDLEATAKANDDRGVDFQIPK
jgi:hypothetical protein